MSEPFDTLNALPLPQTKNDGGQAASAGNYTATDANQARSLHDLVRQAAVALNATVISGVAATSATVAAPTAGQAIQRNNAGVLERSENGAAFKPTWAFDNVAASASGGALALTIREHTNVHVSLDADLAVPDPTIALGAASQGKGTLLMFEITQDATGCHQLSFTGTKFKNASTLMPRQGPSQRTTLWFVHNGDGTFELLTSNAIDTSKPHDIRDWGAVGDNSTDNTQALQNLLLYFSAVPAVLRSHLYYAGHVVTNAEKAYWYNDTGGNSGTTASSGGPTHTSGTVTDGTVAWTFLGYAPLTASGGRTGAIAIPKGVFQYKDHLQYIGSPSVGLNILGIEGAARGGEEGSCIKFTGTSSGNGLHLRGANGTRIKDICISGGSLARRPLWLSEYYPGPTVYDTVHQLSGSSGVFFENCYFSGNGPSTDSVSCYVGPDNEVTNNLECSEARFQKCSFSGRGDIIGLAGVYIASPGNTKNFTFDLCIFTDFDFGVYQPSGSGTTHVIGCEFSGMGYNQDGCCIYMGSGNALEVENLIIENGGTGPDGVTEFRARATYTGEDVVCSVQLGYLAGILPSDDIAMLAGGPLSVLDFSFEQNARSGSNVCKVAGPNLFVAGCDWAWNTTAIQWAPLYDDNNNPYASSDVYRLNTALSGRCTAKANHAGPHGTNHTTNLRNFDLDRSDAIRGSFGIDPNNGYQATGVSYVAEDGRFYLLCDYTAFQTGALSKQFIATEHTGRAFIRHVTAEILTPFAGVTGPLALMLGHQPAIGGGGSVVDASLMASCDPTAAAGTVYGIADAELGSKLTVAGRDSDAGLYLPAPNGGCAIKVKMVSSSGNLSGLTAGKVRFCLLYDYVGSGV